MSVSALRGRSVGLVSVLPILISKLYIVEGASQYADIPLSYFILGAIGGVYFYERLQDSRFLFLAGMYAGFAAWTKNEGVLFLAVFCSVFFVQVIRWKGINEGLRRGVVLLAGILPGLAVVAFYKWKFAPPNDLLFAQNGTWVLGNVFDLTRHITIAKAFANEIIRIAGPLLAVGFIFFKVHVCGEDERPLRFSFTVLGVMVIAYYIVYLTTPKPLEWHLVTSLRRILFHLWPAFILSLFFIFTPFADEIESRGAEPALINKP